MTLIFVKKKNLPEDAWKGTYHIFYLPYLPNSYLAGVNFQTTSIALNFLHQQNTLYHDLVFETIDFSFTNILIVIFTGWWCFSDRWQVTQDMWHVTPENFLFFCLFWYWCYYRHTSRDAVSPVCGICFKSHSPPGWILPYVWPVIWGHAYCNTHWLLNGVLETDTKTVSSFPGYNSDAYRNPIRPNNSFWAPFTSLIVP